MTGFPTTIERHQSPLFASLAVCFELTQFSPERVRQLIDAGNLAGTFSIPSAGRFGKALRIPAETVLAAEMEWAIASSLARVVKKPRPRSSHELALKHFPELAEDKFNGKAEI